MNDVNYQEPPTKTKPQQFYQFDEEGDEEINERDVDNPRENSPQKINSDLQRKAGTNQKERQK